MKIMINKYIMNKYLKEFFPDKMVSQVSMNVVSDDSKKFEFAPSIYFPLKLNSIDDKIDITGYGLKPNVTFVKLRKFVVSTVYKDTVNMTLDNIVDMSDVEKLAIKHKVDESFILKDITKQLHLVSPKEGINMDRYFIPHYIYALKLKNIYEFFNKIGFKTMSSNNNLKEYIYRQFYGKANEYGYSFSKIFYKGKIYNIPTSNIILNIINKTSFFVKLNPSKKWNVDLDDSELMKKINVLIEGIYINMDYGKDYVINQNDYRNTFMDKDLLNKKDLIYKPNVLIRDTVDYTDIIETMERGNNNANTKY